jgi:hypothetical protein
MAFARSMGIGLLGNPNTIIKRKFRFDFQLDVPNLGGEGTSNIPIWYVKIANRPQLDIDELELQFLNASTWIPGKGRWQPLNITYIDTADDKMQPLYNWIAQVYDFQAFGTTNGVELSQTERKGWDATATINMYDGCGSVIETWVLKGCWPQSVNFGDLEYGSNDESTIELTLRYDKVTITKGTNCGVTPQGNCTGCITNS